MGDYEDQGNVLFRAGCWLLVLAALAALALGAVIGRLLSF